MPRDKLDLTGLRVLDGGLATELERAGCDLASPLWSGEVLRTQPEKVLAVHRSYLEAGADCLLTASYQLSAMGFREIGLTARAASTAIQQSVALAEQARHDYAQSEIDGGRKPRRIWIAGSLGAYGAALHNGAEFHGHYNIGHAELVAFHAERINAMRDTNADFLAFETIPSLAEAEAILEALSQLPRPRRVHQLHLPRRRPHRPRRTDRAVRPPARCRPRHHRHRHQLHRAALRPSADSGDPRGHRQTHRRLSQLRRNLGSRNPQLDRHLRSRPLWRPGGCLAQRRSRLDRRLLPHRPATHPGDCKPTRLMLFHKCTMC